MRKKKIRTFKLLKNILVFPDDIIYKISKYCFNYTYYPKINKNNRIKYKLRREKRFIYVYF